jgi:hypothetical protein
MKKTPDKTPKTQVVINLTKDEWSKLYKQFSDSTHIYFRRYLKDILMAKPVTQYFRNKSLDEILAVMNQLKNKMESVDRLFKMISEKLQIAPSHVHVARWQSALDNSWQMHRTTMEEIRLQLIKIYEICLQQSHGSKI